MKSRSAKFSGRKNNRKRNSATSRAWKIGLCSAVLAATFSWSSHGQEVKPAPSPTARQVERPSLQHVYMHFFLYQNHLDKAAAAHEVQGKDGSWLRDHFQQQLGFTSAQFAIVRATGVRLESELKELGSEAKTIAEADRAARRENPETPRVPDPRLKDLTKQREDLLQREIDGLNQELGPERAAKLQDFLHNHFLQNTSSLHPHVRPHPTKRLQPQPQAVPQP
jgi:hypothetical protein